MRLNLGAGDNPPEGYVNVDVNPLTNPDLCFDIGDHWPLDDNSVDEFRVAHVLEHLAGDKFFTCLKEIYRTGKPGALLKVVIPHPRHDVFLNDPTHVRVVTVNQLALFSRKFVNEQRAKGVFFTAFGDWYDVDFDIIGPVQNVLDARIKPEDDWAAMERAENNVVIEVHFGMRVVK